MSFASRLSDHGVNTKHLFSLGHRSTLPLLLQRACPLVEAGSSLLILKLSEGARDGGRQEEKHSMSAQTEHILFEQGKNIFLGLFHMLSTKRDCHI